MQRHKLFLPQLENFYREANIAAQYLYSGMTIQHAASKSKRLLDRLNLTPRFWLTHSAATQTAAYLCLARVFDKSSAYNIEALLNSFDANLLEFSQEALAKRKRNGDGKYPDWLPEYLNNAYYPTKADVARLRKRVATQRLVYERLIEPARHKYLAHRVKTEHHEVQALFGAGKVRELWRMVTFLYALHEALWEQYHNGRKPLVRQMRYSVKSLYEAKQLGRGPHEAIVEETKKLMTFIEGK